MLIRAQVGEIKNPNLVLGTRRYRTSGAIRWLKDLFDGFRAQSNACGLPQNAERRRFDFFALSDSNQALHTVNVKALG